MAIARVIERITQRAQQGGIIAVLTSLGDELRGDAIPAPLRVAARRLATLLDGKRPALDAGQAQGHTDGPAIMVNVAVAVAVGAAPTDATAGPAKPVVATAVAMSPGASDDTQPEASDGEAPDAEDAEGAGEVAWRSGLAPRA